VVDADLAGGSAALIALQTAAIVTAVPVSIVMGVAAISLLRAFRFEVATTANYLRIVGSSDAIPLEVGRVVVDGQPGEDPAMVVAFHSLRPTSVEVDENTGTVQLVPEPYGVDPLRPNGNGTANGVD
jgi:choline/glycine/proline betaine transport protein